MLQNGIRNPEDVDVRLMMFQTVKTETSTHKEFFKNESIFTNC